jgi:hypothetical protein
MFLSNVLNEIDGICETAFRGCPLFLSMGWVFKKSVSSFKKFSKIWNFAN